MFFRLHKTVITKVVILTKFVIFGNSASGKSTLAKKLAMKNQLAHLDLDTIAWMSTPQLDRLAISESSRLIKDFLSAHNSWVIEGCYADLLELVSSKAEEMIFLNLPVSECITNARARPWEPHKYASKEAQDVNLAMLIDWISHYTERDDTFSKLAHEKLFNEFQGKKIMYVSKEEHT